MSVLGLVLTVQEVEVCSQNTCILEAMEEKRFWVVSNWLVLNVEEEKVSVNTDPEIGKVFWKLATISWCGRINWQHWNNFQERFSKTIRHEIHPQVQGNKIGKEIFKQFLTDLHW